MNKKWVTLGALGVLVLGGGFWGYKHFTAKPATTSTITDKAKMGDVRKTISATGTVNFPNAIPLTFQQSGKIVELDVKPGDTVKAGQVLAKVDDTKLRNAVTQQQANLQSAQANLQAVKDKYNAQTLAQAQSTYARAQQALTTAQQNADPSYLANQVSLANQNVQMASDALAKAQQSGNESSIQQAQSSLNQALSSLTSAKNAQNGGAAQALTAAQADVTAAKYQVDQQEQGPKQSDLQSAETNILQSQISLSNAQTDLSNATLTSPVDGVVVSSPLELYQIADSKSIITITPSAKNLEVDASIDQADIAQVKVGQKVDITLDAYADQHIPGTVTEVAQQGTTTQNVTTFTVTVTVDQANDLLRAGMNANVNIILAESKNVLTVPSEAIKTRGNEKGVLVPATSTSTDAQQADKSTRKNTNSTGGYAGSASANPMAGTKFVPVEVGLDDGTNAEIKSGLTEGQEIIIGFRSTTTQTKSTTGFGPSSSGNNPGQSMGQLNRAVGGNNGAVRRN